MINNPGLSGTILVLALKVLYSGKSPSPGQTRIVSHPSCHLSPFFFFAFAFASMFSLSSKDSDLLSASLLSSFGRCFEWVGVGG